MHSMKKILILITLPLLLLAEFLPFEVIQKANEAYAKGEYARSARLFSQLDTNRSIQAYNMGNAYYKAKQYHKAIQAYQQAKGMDEMTRLYNLGNAHFQLNQLDQAIAYYTKALQIREDADCRHNLALVKRKKAAQEAKKKQPKKKEQKKPAPHKKKPPKPHKRPSKDASNKKPKPPQPRQPPSSHKMTPQERLSQKELKRLMKKLKQERMPTMIYPLTSASGDRHDKKPW